MHSRGLGHTLTTASIVAASVATLAITAIGMLAYMFWRHRDGQEKVLATNHKLSKFFL